MNEVTITLTNGEILRGFITGADNGGTSLNLHLRTDHGWTGVSLDQVKSIVYANR